MKRLVGSNEYKQYRYKLAQWHSCSSAHSESWDHITT